MNAWEKDPAVDVLIAEDDELLRLSLRLLLEQEGYTCAEAATGREALEVAHRHRPRCVLLDLGMPELDGLAVTRLLRSDPRTRAAHIHCLTGVSDPESRRLAEDAGCERFLVKPVEPEALLEAIQAPAQGGEEARGPDSVSGLTLAEAEGLLDRLQNQGCEKLEASLDEGGVTVRCVCPPGLRLTRDAGGAVRLLPEPGQGPTSP
jgi:CheY-like chemotaxis protein